MPQTPMTTAGRGRGEGDRRRWRSAAVLLVMALVAAPLIASVGSSPAGAAPGDATPQLTEKNVDVTSAEGGDLVTYTITFSCSNSIGGPEPDGCDGSQFTDPLPTFTDIYGGTVPVEFVSATGPASVFPDGFSVDDSTDPPTVVGTAGTWPAGTSGVISVTVRVPPNTVPPGSQDLTNTATITDPDDGAIDDSTTATTTISGTEPSWTVSKLGPGEELRVNRDYGWVISICTDDPASAAWPVYEITDTVPAGFEYEGSDPAGVYTDDGDPPDDVSDGAGTITWTFDESNPPPIGADGCFRINVTGRFPSDHPSNVDGAEKTNTASGTGSDGDGTETDLGDDTATGVIVGPQFGGVGMGKRYSDPTGADDFFVADGDEGRFNLSLTVDSDFLLDRVTLQDGTWSFDDGSTTDGGTGLPESFTPTSIVPGTWNDPVTATIEGSVDGTGWTSIATGIASGGAAIDVTGDGHRFIRWVWEAPGAIRGDFATTGQQIVGVVGEPEDDFGRYTDVATTTVEWVGDEGPTSASASADDDYVLETPQPHPGISKSVDQPTRQPGQEATYTIVVDNDPDATGDLVSPAMEDCIPEFLDVTGGPDAGAGWIEGAPVTCATGETPVSFQYQGTLAPGEATTPITYTIVVRSSDPGPPAPYGGYTNTAFVLPEGGDGTFGHCRNTSPTCGSEVTLTVPPTVELRSAKCVSGELDDGVYRPTPACTPGEPAVLSAQTLPGAEIDYRLSLTNVGNTDATNVDFIDILPYVGDTAIITGTPLNPRGSEYRAILLTPITAPAGWTVAYSTAANPCRPEVGGPSSGCQDPAWTTTPDLLGLGSYRSIRLSYDDLLARGATATFTWDMRAPAASPSYDQGGTSDTDPYEFLRTCDPLAVASDPNHCPRAVNSFAYGADAGGLPPGVPAPGRLFAEPPSVEVRVVGPPPSNAIGDRVWYDEDYDGIQDPGEEGIPGIGVELRGLGGGLVAQAFTDDDGRYLFNTVGNNLPIPDGVYDLRFYPPEGWYVSPQDETGGPTDEGAPGGSNPGTNTGDDSDLPRVASGVHPSLGPFHATVDITLGDNPNVLVGTPSAGETDRTWDLGLWRAEPAIAIDKVTGDSAWPEDEYGDGVAILQGRPVTWRYTVTNTGNTRLEDVVVSDDAGTPGDTSDDLVVTDCEIVDDGENADGLTSSADDPIALNRGASMECTATGVAGPADHSNLGTVEGTPVTDAGEEVTTSPPGFPPLTSPVTDSDPSSYLNARYDLALAKVVGAPDLSTGDVTFTITVRNQGTVPSGAYTVTDSLTPGLSVNSTAPTATSTTGDSEDGVGLTWDIPSLAPGADQVITIDAHIDDYLERPFRNLAEISADSSALVETGGVPTPTEDVDSTPDTVAGNDGDYGPVGEPTDIDNASIADAGVGPDAPPAGEDDADIADLDPDITYDLALAKTAAATAPTQDADATVTYTITVQNQGNVPSGSYTVTDVVPPGLTVHDAGGGTVTENPDGSSTVVLAGTDLAPGALATFTIAVTATDLTIRPYRNVAEISADSADDLYAVTDVDSTPDTDATNDGDYGPIGTPSGVDNLDIAEAGVDPDPEDDADIADVTFPLVYDIALAKTADATIIEPDGTIDYEVTVQNQGVVDSREVTVTDQVPDGLAVDEESISDDGVLSDDGSTVTWTLANLDPAETVTLTFSAEVDDITLRPYRNVVEISADSADDYSVAGDPVADVDSTPDTDATNDGDYGPIGTPSGVDNLDIADAGVDPDPEDDADIADVDVDVVYDLALIKTGPATMDPLGEVTFEVTVQNQGNVPSGPYSVTDVAPPGLVITGASPVAAVAGDGGSLVWADLPSLDPDETATLTVTMRADPIPGGLALRPWTNFAEITEDGADAYSTETETVTDVDSVPGDEETSTADDRFLFQAGQGADAGFDDEDIAVVTTQVIYDLALSKLTSTEEIPYDGTVTFTIIVANQGNVPSGVATVTDDVPPGLAAENVGQGGVLSDDGATITWQVEVDPGDQVELTFDATISDITLRPWTNVAEITADGADAYSTETEPVTDIDSVPGDEETSEADDLEVAEAGGPGDEGFDDEDVAVVATTVIYDLAIDKALLPFQRYQPGDVVTYEVTVTNEGNVPSGLYSFTDTIPPGMSFAAASHGGTASGQVVTWTDRPSLDPGDSATVTVSATLDDVSLGSYRNWVQITDDSADTYSAPDDPITDVDSTPGNGEQGEDDDDDAVFAVDPPGVGPDDVDRWTGADGLSRTGGDLSRAVLLAASLAAAGAALLLGSRRRILR